MAKKGSVKWNIPEVSEAKRSPRTPRSARSLGDSASERYVYTDTFEEPSQSHIYTDTFVSDSQDSYSDTFINGSGVSKSASGNGTSDIRTVISAVGRGNNKVSEQIDTVYSGPGTEAIDTVIEADTHATEAIDTVIEIDTHITEAVDTVIDTAIDTLASETVIDSTYSDTHPPGTYTDTFETGEETDEDDYSRSEFDRTVTRSYTPADSQLSSYSSYTRDRDKSKDTYSRSSEYSVSLGERSMSPRLTDEDSYTEDDYSYTFEPTEISYQVHFVDPAEIERETEIQLQTEVAQKDFIEQTINRLKKKDHSKKPVKKELLTLDEVKDEDVHVTHYCKKKIKLLRRQRKGDDSSPAVNEETRLDNAKPHPPEKRGSQLSDYGLSHVVLERMKIKRVLSAMEKAAQEEIHDPRSCPTCRNTNKVSHSLDPDQALQYVGPDLGSSVCKDYQQEHYLVSNGLDPDQDRHFVCPDLGANCLQIENTREKRAELDAEAAERLFTQSRAKSLQNKIIDLQVEEHLLKMNSVSMIAEIARSLPRASEKPEKILDQLFEPLLGKNVMR